MQTPLFRPLNVAIQTISSRLFPTGFDVGTDADSPSTLQELNLQLAATGRMRVSGEHPEDTIYGDAEVNAAFRAWHDWVHWTYQLPFNCEGERIVAEIQIGQLARLYGRDHPHFGRMAELIRAEVVGQCHFNERHGHFPTDQRAFVSEFIDGGGAWALRPY